jgi:hypothetical protein
MTRHNSDLLEGQLELMTASGRDFLFGEVPFTALVKDASSLEDESFDLTPGDDDEVVLTALRSSFPTTPQIGDSFVDAYGATYRIKSIRRPPNHITIRFHCQVTFP